MRLALCAEVIKGLEFRAQCAFARAVGYDGLEIAPFRLGEDPRRVPAATIAQWRRIAAEEGVAITGFHYAMIVPAGLSITSNDAAVRARTLEVMRALCTLCAALGGAYVVHGSPEQRSLDPGDEAACRQRGAEAYARAGEAAQAEGVTYLVEPVRASRTPFINTIAEAADIVTAANSAGLRSMLDCCTAGHAEAEAPEKLLDHWLPRGMIAHVHANDPNLRGPGEGAMRFAPIIAALQRHGYQGTIAVEPFVFEPDGQACAARAAGYLRGLMEAA
jgi:sugar phosphate isomerase/epimerase